MCKKVLLIGGADTKTPVPVVEAGVERWGINNLVRGRGMGPRFKHCTRWFDLHEKAHIVARKSGNIWNWYQKLEIPLYMWTTFADLPTSCVYPSNQVRAMFGGTRLFTSSLDWQIALALYEGFEEIELYGYRMTHPNYRFQVGSGQWWLRQCAERGVKVAHLTPTALTSIARRATLLSPQPGPQHLMYGLETTDRSKLFRGR